MRFGQIRFRFRPGRKHQTFTFEPNQCTTLDQLPEGYNATVIHNNNLKTIERGLYIGASITVFRNNVDEPNVIVAVGDARYALDRRIAKNIKVKST